MSKSTQNIRPKREIKCGIVKSKRNPKNNLKLGFINAQCAMNKALSIRQYIIDNDIDV